MSSFILFHVISDKNPNDISPELVAVQYIANIRPSDNGDTTRVLTRDGKAFKATWRFEDVSTALNSLVVTPRQTKAAAKAADPIETVAAKDDELNEEETPVDKDKNKSLTQKKK
jgi:hypothetical protein